MFSQTVHRNTLTLVSTKNNSSVVRTSTKTYDSFFEKYIIAATKEMMSGKKNEMMR